MDGRENMFLSETDIYTKHEKETTHVYMYICLYQYIYLPTCLPAYLSFYLSQSQSIYLSVDPIDDTKPALP